METDDMLEKYPTGGSPLDVEGVNTEMSREEILEFIREGRKYS